MRLEQNFHRHPSRPNLCFLALLACMVWLGCPLLGAALHDITPENLEPRLTSIKTSKGDRISGVLPKGWQEDSAWADVAVSYTLEKGASGHPPAYLRASMDKHKNGHAQIKLPFSGKEGRQYIRLTIRARSTSKNHVKLLLRQQSAPYRSYWEGMMRLDHIWREYTYDIELDTSETKLAIIAVLGKSGKVDIARLFLDRQSREEVVEQLKKAHPQGEPANAMSHSRLPAGIPSEWTYAAEASLGDELLVQPDLEQSPPPEIMPIPGVAPLHISTRYSVRSEAGEALEQHAPLRLCTEPFAISAPYEDHTMSVFAMGALSSGKLSIYADGQWIRDHNFALKPGDGWKRISFPFTPKLLAKHYVVKLDGKGEFWVDGWQVNPGKKAEPLAAPNPAELTLMMDSASRVVFEGDPVELRCTILSHSLPDKGAMLVTREINAYGTAKGHSQEIRGERALREVVLESHFAPKNGGAAAFGPVLVTTWVEVKGKRVTPVQELIYNVVPQPTHLTRDARESFFGAHLPATRRHIQMAKSIGINWVRLNDASLPTTSWAEVEAEPGEWVFRDDLIERYRKGHLLVLGQLVTTPPWARVGDYRETKHEKDLFIAPADHAKFGRYVEATAQHYAGKIAAWDIWPLPWAQLHAGFDKDAKNWNDRWVKRSDDETLDEYVQLTRTAKAALERGDPEATLVGVNGSYRGSGERWMERAVQRGLVEETDAIGFQALWTDDRGEMVDPASNYNHLLIRNITAPLRAMYLDFPRPLWMTDASYSVGAYEPGMHGWGEAEVEQQRQHLWNLADRAVRFSVGAQAAGVEKVFFYTMQRGEFLTMSDQYGKAALVGKDSFLVPSGVALAVFAHHTGERKLVKRHQIRPGIFAAYYKSENDTMAVLMPVEGELVPAMKPAKELTVLDLFGNPLQKDAAHVLGSSLYVQSGLSIGALESTLEKLLPPAKSGE